MLITVPAAIGLFLLAEPLVATLFYRGEFDEHAVRMTAMALRAYALGLVGFSYVKILAPAFFAREDTRTPVRIALIALAVNLIISVTLAWYLTRIGFAGSHVGLAVATSVAALLNAWLLYKGLRREEVLRHTPGWMALLSRALLANAAMWAILAWLRRPLGWWLESGLMDRGSWLGASVVIGAAAYFVVLFVLGLRPSNFRLRH